MLLLKQIKNYIEKYQDKLENYSKKSIFLSIFGVHLTTKFTYRNITAVLSENHHGYENSESSQL